MVVMHRRTLKKSLNENETYVFLVFSLKSTRKLVISELELQESNLIARLYYTSSGLKEHRIVHDTRWNQNA
jgi:hypothetical protein